jgi:2-oxoisovalerate dehydrogenase E1 component
MIAVAEIMFGDFMTLTFDQLYQHATKFSTMYNGRVEVPLVVRTPMGGKRGYGPTHSQSIEKFFLGIPGLTVLALNNRLSPLETYRTLFSSLKSPALVIENKILYTRFLDQEPPTGFSVEFSDEQHPTVRISPESSEPDVTVVCYGGNLEDAEHAANQLFDEDEILCEIICPTQLFPLNIEPIAGSVGKTGRVLIIEEGPTVAGFGSEVLGRLSELGVSMRKAARLGYDGLIPASAGLELELLPNTKSIAAAVRGLMRG